MTHNKKRMKVEPKEVVESLRKDGKIRGMAVRTSRKFRLSASREYELREGKMADLDLEKDAKVYLETKRPTSWKKEFETLEAALRAQLSAVFDRWSAFQLADDHAVPHPCSLALDGDTSIKTALVDFCRVSPSEAIKCWKRVMETSLSSTSQEFLEYMEIGFRMVAETTMEEVMTGRIVTTRDEDAVLVVEDEGNQFEGFGYDDDEDDEDDDDFLP